MENDARFSVFFGWAFLCLLCSSLFCLLFAVVVADTRPDYCYIDTTFEIDHPVSGYPLFAHRPWRPNIRIGKFNTLEEANKAALSIGCSSKADENKK